MTAHSFYIKTNTFISLQDPLPLSQSHLLPLTHYIPGTSVIFLFLSVHSHLPLNLRSTLPKQNHLSPEALSSVPEPHVLPRPLRQWLPPSSPLLASLPLGLHTLLYLGLIMDHPLPTTHVSLALTALDNIDVTD